MSLWSQESAGSGFEDFKMAMKVKSSNPDPVVPPLFGGQNRINKKRNIAVENSLKIFINLVVFLSLTAVAPAMCFAKSETDEKPRMAVMRFTNNTAAYWWKSGVGAELSDMLTNELASSKKFSMIERKEIDKVISEVNFNQSGYVDQKTKVKMQKIKGAKYLVMATVTGFEEDTDNKGGGLSFMGITVGGKSAKASLSVDLKVVDTETSEVIDTRTIECSSENTSRMLSGNFMGIGFGGDKAQKTPVTKAIRGAVVNIAEYLECSMVDKDSCMDKYKVMEAKRRAKDKDSISLDE